MSNPNLNLFDNSLTVFFLIISLTLVALNLFGVLRSPLRDIPRKVLSKETFGRKKKTSVSDLDQKGEEDPFHYIFRLVHKINSHMIHFKRVKKHCPASENFILYLCSFLPFNHFKDYEFYSISRILRVGYGWCSQVSILSYFILKKNGFSPSIIGFPGHVVVYVIIEGRGFILDPDYGVFLESTLGQLPTHSKLIEDVYAVKTSMHRIKLLVDIYQKPCSKVPENVLSRNKTIEDIAYFFKWVIPILLFGFAFMA